MVVKAIKDFVLKIGEYTDIKTTVPTSVVTALLSHALIPDPYFGYGAEASRGLCSMGATYTATVEVDGVMLSKRYIALRVRGTDAPFVITVNGEPIARITNKSVKYTFDVRQYLTYGDNQIEVKFDPRESKETDFITDLAIYEPLEIIAYDYAMIDNVIVSQVHTEGMVRLDISLSAIGSLHNTRAVATLISPGGSVSYCGLSDCKGSVNIPIPNLWAPGTLGEPNLYRFTLNLYHETELIDAWEAKIGLRDFALVNRDSTPALTLGGSRYFPIGAVHVREDLIKPRQTVERTRRLLERARETGINTLYLREFDAYPPDYFFDMCDELGLSLWIDIPGEYLAATPAEASVHETELRRMLTGLSLHPSVTLLLGHPHIADTLQRLVQELVPTAAYLPRAYGVEPFGIPSLPSPVTARSFAPEEELNFLSPAMQHRCTSHLPELLGYILDGYRMPAGFGEFVYLTELLSATHAEDMVLSARLSGAPMGAIFDRLSDSIPKPSSSALDYFERPKALWYHTKRFTRQNIVKAELDGTRVKFYVSNLRDNLYMGRLTYMIVDNDNVEIIRDSIDFEVEPNSAAVVLECDLGSAVRGHEREYYLAYRISDAQFYHPIATALFVPPREFKFKKPTMKVDITGTGSEYTLTIISDVYARAVAIDFGDEDVTLDDNYFDITSGAPVRIGIHSYRPTALAALQRQLSVRSLYDIGRI